MTKQCSLCGSVFKNGAGLSGHQRLIHPGGVHIDGRKVVDRLDSIGESLDVLTASFIAHQELEHNLKMNPSRLEQFSPGVRAALKRALST